MKLPAPKLENIEKGIKFTTSGPDQFGKCRLVASLHVGSSVWFSEREAARHPDMMEEVKRKLRLHLLWQLYHNQIIEMHEAVDAVLLESRGGFMSEKFFEARDRLLAVAKYTPPAGFGDDEDEQFCGSESCACSQFEFHLEPKPSGIPRTSNENCKG